MGNSASPSAEIDAEDGDPMLPLIWEDPPEAVSEVSAEVEGDHPDPVTLGEPSYDDQGLLRWGSMPLPRGLAG